VEAARVAAEAEAAEKAETARVTADIQAEEAKERAAEAASSMQTMSFGEALSRFEGQSLEATARRDEAVAASVAEAERERSVEELVQERVRLMEKEQAKQMEAIRKQFQDEVETLRKTLSQPSSPAPSGSQDPSPERPQRGPDPSEGNPTVLESSGLPTITEVVTPRSETSHEAPVVPPPETAILTGEPVPDAASVPIGDDDDDELNSAVAEVGEASPSVPPSVQEDSRVEPRP
jgi:dTMP kinase